MTRRLFSTAKKRRPYRPRGYRSVFATDVDPETEEETTSEVSEEEVGLSADEFTGDLTDDPLADLADESIWAVTPGTDEDYSVTEDDFEREEAITNTSSRRVANDGVLDSLNPTGTIFTEYAPEDRAGLELAPHIRPYSEVNDVDPNERMVVYRGVPKGVQSELADGDFITDMEQLAKDYAGYPYGDVISQEVFADEILDDMEYPMSGEYLFRPRRASKKTANDRRTFYHLTENPNFAPDPNFRPANNTTLGGDWDPGLFVAEELEPWVNGYDYIRPWVAEMSAPADIFDRDGVKRGYSRERMIPASEYGDISVDRMIPFDAYARERFGGPGWAERHHEKAFDGAEISDWNSTWYAEGRPWGEEYRFEGDIRDWTPEQQDSYSEFVKDFGRQARGLVYEGDPGWEDDEDDYYYSSKKTAQDYFMNHRPAGPSNGSPMHDVSYHFPDIETLPRNVYDDMQPGGQDSIQQIIDTQGNPDRPVTIYRGVPKGVDPVIRNGDWVTISRDYAVEHGNYFDESDVLSATVPAKDLWTSGDSVNEFGYWGSDVRTARIASRTANSDFPALPEDFVRNISPDGFDSRWTYETTGYEPRSSDDRYDLSINPVNSPAVIPGEENGLRKKPIFYDPERTELEWDELFGHSPTRQDRDLSHLSPPEGLLWRGMSNEEYENAKRDGYFQSKGEWNFEGQEGETYFSTDPNAAANYANDFAPIQFKPGFGNPAHVIGIPDRPELPRYEHEVGVPGQIPFSDVVQHYTGHPTAISPGSSSYFNDISTGEWSEGGGSGPSVSLAWEPGEGYEPKTSRRDPGGFSYDTPVPDIKVRAHRRTPERKKDPMTAIDRYLRYASRRGMDPKSKSTLRAFGRSDRGTSKTAQRDISRWFVAQKVAHDTARDVLASSRNYRRKMSSSWHLDNKLSAYVSKVQQKFACSCGAKLDVPAYNICKCGKIWNAYKVHSATKGDTMYVVREVPVRENVLVAGRGKTASRRRSNRRHALDQNFYEEFLNFAEQQGVDFNEVENQNEDELSRFDEAMYDFLNVNSVDDDDRIFDLMDAASAFGAYSPGGNYHLHGPYEDVPVTPPSTDDWMRGRPRSSSRKRRSNRRRQASNDSHELYKDFLEYAQGQGLDLDRMQELYDRNYETNGMDEEADHAVQDFEEMMYDFLGVNSVDEDMRVYDLMEGPGMYEINHPYNFRSSRRRQAYDVEEDTFDFFEKARDRGYRLPKNMGDDPDSGTFQDELHNYTGGDRDRMRQVTDFARDNWGQHRNFDPYYYR